MLGFGLGMMVHPLNPSTWKSEVGLRVLGQPRLQSKAQYQNLTQIKSGHECRGFIYIPTRLLMVLAFSSLLWPHILSNTSRTPCKLSSSGHPPKCLKNLLLNTHLHKDSKYIGSVDRMMPTCAFLRLCSTENWGFGDRLAQCTSWFCLLSAV